MAELPKIGDLTERVTLRKPVETEDGYGGKRKTWQDVADVWAGIQSVSSGVRFFAQQRLGEVTHKIYLRHRSDVDLGWQIRCGEDHYSVSSLINLGGRFLELLCIEVKGNE